MIVSNNESDSEEERAEKDILPALEDYTNVSGITIQFEDPQTRSEITNLLFDKYFFLSHCFSNQLIPSPKGKIPQKNNNTSAKT